eukprot:scaffold204817_cov21-Tisochrysis_lutea.AAC.3
MRVECLITKLLQSLHGEDRRPKQQQQSQGGAASSSQGDDDDDEIEAEEEEDEMSEGGGDAGSGGEVSGFCSFWPQVSVRNLRKSGAQGCNTTI